MDGNEFMVNCSALGLKVSRAGIIKDKVFDYGMVRGGSLQLPGKDKRTVPLTDVIQVSYSDTAHRLTLDRLDESVSVIEGGRFAESDLQTHVQSLMMPTCLLELNEVFDTLFPTVDDDLYFDVLNEQIAFKPSMLGMDGGREGYILFGDEYVPAFILRIQSRLREMGFVGRRYPAKEVCLDALKFRAFKNQRNLFREWLESLKWDGRPRMRRWFIDGLGVTAPALEHNGKDQIYLESATEAWFLGTVRRQYAPTKVEVVPVFVGGEGLGKGNFLRYTAGYRDDWFIDTSAPLEGPGAEQKFLEGIRGRVIVELSESIQFASPKGADLLKTFVSKTEDQCRKAYAAFQSTSIRRFTLVATSNQNNVFVDTGGGNRRYFPMYCDPDKAVQPFDPKYKQVGRYEMEQAWAEAMYLFKTKPNSDAFISKEVAELAAVMQDYGTRENTNVLMIDDWLDDPENGYSEVGSRICKEIILRDILGVSPDSVIPKSADYAYTTWSNIQKCWRKIRQTVRLDGKISHTGYERIRTPKDLLEKKRSNMVNVAPEDIGTFVDVVGLIRKRSVRYGYHQFGDEFPIDGLSSAEVDALLAQGYIYEDRLGHYCLTMMP